MSGTRSVRLVVGAPAERTYALVADVTRMGEWSPECYRCEWDDGAPGAAEGASFTGYNRLGPFKWNTRCLVERAEPGRTFTFVAGDDREGKTRWTYRFEPRGAGCEVTESYETLIPAPVWIRAVERVMLLGRSRDANLLAAMRVTLERVKAAAEARQD